jgi:hypothetical protein
LLIAVSKSQKDAFEVFAKAAGFELKPIGQTIPQKEKAIYLK